MEHLSPRGVRRAQRGAAPEGGVALPQRSNVNCAPEGVSSAHPGAETRIPDDEKILQESIRFVQFDDTDVEALAEPSAQQNELRFEKPGIVQYAFSFQGHEQLETEVKNLPQTVYQRFLAADNGLARSAGIALLERLVLVNPLIIYNTNFVKETSLLAVDRLSSVRKSALETIETLLEAYSNCFALICVYCRIWACLMSDEDVALQKLAISVGKHFKSL